MNIRPCEMIYICGFKACQQNLPFRPISVLAHCIVHEYPVFLTYREQNLRRFVGAHWRKLCVWNDRWEGYACSEILRVDPRVSDHIAETRPNGTEIMIYREVNGSQRPMLQCNWKRYIADQGVVNLSSSSFISCNSRERLQCTWVESHSSSSLEMGTLLRMVT